MKASTEEAKLAVLAAAAGVQAGFEALKNVDVQRAMEELIRKAQGQSHKIELSETPKLKR